MSKAERRRQEKHLRNQELQRQKQAEKKQLKEHEKAYQKQKVTASEISKSWSDAVDMHIDDMYRHVMLGGRHFYISGEEVPSDSPDKLIHAVKQRIQSQWTRDKQDSTKTISEGGQLTRAEQLAKLEEKHYGLANPYAPKEYMYRFVDGEAEVVEGNDWLLAAAYEMEKLYKKVEG